MELFHTVMNGLVRGTIIILKGVGLFVLAFIAFIGVIFNSVHK